MKLKLYRGLSAQDFELLTPKVFEGSRKVWKQILSKRARGAFKYPQALDPDIHQLAKVARLERQHFTDNKGIATTYARKNQGLLVQLEIPVDEIIQHFRLEFQNFGQRKKNFEIVYVVDAKVLAKHAKKWELKAKRL